MSGSPQVGLTQRLILFFGSIAVLGVGVSVMVRADLGVAPNDVLNTGLAQRLNLGVGSAAWITAAIAVVISWALGRRPRVTTVVGAGVAGLFINASLAALPQFAGMGWRATALAAGLILIWMGITGLVAADVGAPPLELMMLALMDRRVGIRAARWGIEATLLIIGLLLGGAAGLGTAIFALGTGPVLALTLPPVSARLGTSLHGEPSRLRSER